MAIDRIFRDNKGNALSVFVEDGCVTIAIEDNKTANYYYLPEEDEVFPIEIEDD